MTSAYDNKRTRATSERADVWVNLTPEEMRLILDVRGERMERFNWTLEKIDDLQDKVTELRDENERLRDEQNTYSGWMEVSF